MFSDREEARYQRHFSLPAFGRRGQEALKNGSVLCIGAGGLGSPAALYLASSGIGRLGLIDNDVVDLSNLQRQILHDEGGIGSSKTESARARLTELNSDILIEVHSQRLNARNVMNLVADYDVILDGSDNFPTRFLVADAAWLQGNPLVAGAIHQFEGQLPVFDPRASSPCYRCLLPEPPPPGAVPT